MSAGATDTNGIESRLDRLIRLVEDQNRLLAIIAQYASQPNTELQIRDVEFITAMRNG